MSGLVNNWHVITGPPSSGTSSTAEEIQKLGFHTIEEAARMYVDEGERRGLSVAQMRANEGTFQENVASLKSIIEKSQAPQNPTFFVRGMQDTVAYMRLQSLPLTPWLQKLMGESSYQNIFILDPLETYDDTDPIRIEDRATARKIGSLLAEAYTETGMNVVQVPAMPVAERAIFIVEQALGSHVVDVRQTWPGDYPFGR